MGSLTVELPEVLVHRLEKSGLSTTEMESLVIRFVEDYLSERESQGAIIDKDGEPERASVKFGRQFIDDNLDLFRELAKR